MYLKLQKLPKYYDKEKKTHYVFWPVFVWDIVIASTKGRKLNVLETSILGFFDAHLFRQPDIELIPKYLDLDPDLVQFIIEQLHANNWLEKNRITPSGEKILHEENLEKETAQIFQCGISGQWWNRVLPKSELEECLIEDLPVKKATDSECFKYIKFDRQRETGNFDKGVCLNFNSSKNKMPSTSTSTVNEIFMNYKRDFDVASATRSHQESMPSYVSSNHHQIQSTSPERAYLFTMVEFVSGQGWCVRDPLNVAYYDPQLTQIFDNLLEENEDLFGEFPWPFQSAETQKEYLDLSYLEVKKAIGSKVKLSLVQDYPLVDRIDGLADHLSHWLSTKLLIEECGEEFDFRENKNFILESAALLELICKWVIEHYPLSNVRCLPDGNTPKHIQRKTLLALVSQLDCLNAEQKEQVVKVDPKNLYLATKGKNSSLNALLLVIWIACFENASNPFTPILSKNDLFERLYCLSDYRNKLAHGQKVDEDLKRLITKTQSMRFFNDINSVLTFIFQEIKING